MGTFEYNEISAQAVERVELISPESSDYRRFKQEIYETTDEIPAERRRLIEAASSDIFEALADELVNKDCEALRDEILFLAVSIPDYVQNRDELRDGIIRRGSYTDVEVEYGDLTPETRADCRYAQDDDYRSSSDALCCWECSPEDSRKPEKFKRDDPSCESCEIGALPGYKLKDELAERLRIEPKGFVSEALRRSELEIDEIQRCLRHANESRSKAIQLAFKVAFPDEDYYYQRAEALLRDLNADVAERSGPGSGGRQFEYDAIKRLEEKFQLRDETVFKVHFDDDAHAVNWREFVSDPSEPTFKEADAIIEGDIGPIVVDFFTQRSTSGKRRQVANYAELYEIATGEKPRAWGITDDTHAELLELDTLTANSSDNPNPDQAALSDYL